MKQNERLLVYAVTGFLALILVIAVVFGGDPANAGQKDEKGGTSLNEILNPAGQNGGDQNGGRSGEANGERGRSGTQGPSATGLSGPQVTPSEQPLRATAPSPSALVQQRIGTYRKDHNVRFVNARPGDSFETLVRRWCGKRDPFLEETIMLNETTRMLREGQEVAVPWVEDEILLTLHEAEQAPSRVVEQNPTRLLTNQPSGQPAPSGTPGPASSGPGYRTPSVAESGRLNLPGSGAPAGSPAGSPAGGSSATGFELYEIQSGDMLWKLLSSRFPTNKVPSMIERVKKLNPRLNTDRLKVGQKIKLPTSAE